MRVGEKVVCIQSASNDFGTASITKGQIYIVLDVMECPKCSVIWLDVGQRCDARAPRCNCGFNQPYTAGIAWCKSTLFRPIQYNSATEELANKEVVEEKSDIPVKEPKKEKV